MKQLVLIAVMILCSICAYAEKDVTQFLGIPVDGTKSEMIRKLKAKGFTDNPYMEGSLIGKFNNKDVFLCIDTNRNNCVSRIAVSTIQPMDKQNVRREFNNLVYQFENNPKYLSMGDMSIDNNEDISDGINLKNKLYQAFFYQRPTNIPESITITDLMFSNLYEQYSKEEIQNWSEEQKATAVEEISIKILELLSPKEVWIRIDELKGFQGEYFITIIYDNGYNRTNGEDL